MVGANLEIMDRDAKIMRGDRPFIFAQVNQDEKVEDIADFIVKKGGM